MKLHTITEEWKTCKLGEFYNIGSLNGVYKHSDFYGIGTQIIRINDYDKEGKYITAERQRVKINQKEIDTYKLEEKDILINRVNSLSHIGKVLYISNLSEPTIFESNMIRINLNEKRIVPKYVFYFLSSEMGRRQSVRKAKRAVAQASINQKDIESILIPFPANLIEQQKIVSILDNADKLIIQTKTIIDQLQTLKRGLMQRLFTEGIGHTEFKETRLGKIPMEWEINQIVKKCEKIYAGGTPLRKKKEFYENGTIPWIKSGEIKNLQIYETEEKINNLGLKNSSAKIFPTKTVLFALYGATAGRVAFIEKSMASNQACLGLICNNDLYYLYLFYYFQFRYKYILSQRIGGAQPNLSAEQVKKLRIIIPSISEQKEIAHLLKIIDNKIDNENNLTKSLKKIKKGLMQDLLTGKKRVKVN